MYIDIGKSDMICGCPCAVWCRGPLANPMLVHYWKTVLNSSWFVSWIKWKDVILAYIIYTHIFHLCTLLLESNWIFFFKFIFDLSVINILKRAFDMTFTRYFVVMLWNSIYLWLFVASGRPFKISKVWKTQFQNTCNWERFGGLFQYMRQIGMGIQIISISCDRNKTHA